MKIDASAFWERFDSLMKEKFSDLGDFCEVAGLNYNTIISQRQRKSVPKIEQLIDMSKALETALDYLISGKESSDPLTLILNSNPTIKNLTFRLTRCDTEQLHCVNSLLNTWRIDRMPGEGVSQGAILA
jgi:transcriptional regulator with XRE-family HTH domain